MGLRIMDYPYGLDDNLVYHQLISDTTESSKFEWSRRALIERFEPAMVSRVIHSDVVREQKGELDLKLTFAIPGTNPNFILQWVYNEVLIFSELARKFTRNMRVDNMKLKNYIAYLKNFHMVDSGPLPGSGLTWVVADREAMDEHLDWIFQLSDRL